MVPTFFNMEYMGLPVGTIEYTVHRKVCEIHELEIGELYRRKGIGRRMLHEFENKMKIQTDVDIVLLFSVESAIPFYEKCGYHRVCLGETETNIYAKSLKGVINVKDAIIDNIYK